MRGLAGRIAAANLRRRADKIMASVRIRLLTAAFHPSLIQKVTVSDWAALPPPDLYRFLAVAGTLSSIHTNDHSFP